MRGLRISPRARLGGCFLLAVAGCQWIGGIGDRQLAERADASSGAGGKSDASGGSSTVEAGIDQDAPNECTLGIVTGPSVRAGHFVPNGEPVRFCLRRAEASTELELPSPSPNCPQALAYKQVSAPIGIAPGHYRVRVVPQFAGCDQAALAELGEIELGDVSATLRFWSGSGAPIVDSVDNSEPIDGVILLRFAQLSPALPALDFGGTGAGALPTNLDEPWFRGVPLGATSGLGFASGVPVPNAKGYVEIASKGARLGASLASSDPPPSTEPEPTPPPPDAAIPERPAVLATWLDGSGVQGHALTLFVVGTEFQPHVVEPLLCDETLVVDGLTACSRGSEVGFSALSLAVGWEYASGDVTYTRRHDELYRKFQDKKFTSDVLCLQELWGFASSSLSRNPDVVDEYPFSYFYESTSETAFTDRNDLSGNEPPPPAQAPCASLESQMHALLDCLKSSCAGDPSFDNSVVKERACISRSCPAEWAAVSVGEGRCAGCVDVMLRGASFSEVRTTCSTQPQPLAFEGTSGTLILSRRPLESVWHIVVPSTWIRKDVLHAIVRDELSGIPLDVYCAYSPPVFDFPGYHGRYGAAENGSLVGNAREKWIHEQQLFIRRLRLFAGSDLTGRALVLGSLGVGPAFAGNTGKNPDLFAELAQDFEVLAPASFTPGCSVCPDNPLVPDTELPIWTDHALGADLRPVELRLTATENYIGVQGLPYDVPLSPHYGVEVSFRMRP